MGHIGIEAFLVVGLSYKNAHIDIREKFSFSNGTLIKILADIYDIDGVSECVVLSTCNRTEIYAVITKPVDEVCKELDRLIMNVSGGDADYLSYFFRYSGTKAIEHLFHVTCGVDSMILGEPQIFGQVKSAYHDACERKYTGPGLNRLFHNAFQLGKQVRSMTSIGQGTVSVSSAAVTLAEEVLGRFTHLSVLLVGAGKIGKLTAKQLIDSGVERLYISNRTTENAEILAEELGGEVVEYANMASMFGKVDIIVSSITASEPVITKAILEEQCAHRQEDQLLLIDLGVPRNIATDTTEIDNVRLFNIDDLESITMDNHEKRKRESEKVKYIIRDKVDDFTIWLKEREVIPVIHNLYEKCESLRVDELERITDSVSAELLDTIDLVSRRMVRKILHSPAIAMRETACPETKSRLVDSINELFINDAACGDQVKSL